MPRCKPIEGSSLSGRLIAHCTCCVLHHKCSCARAAHMHSCSRRQTLADHFFSSGNGDRADGELGSTCVETSSTGKGFEELLEALRAALQQDGSGMLFNETARKLRGDGVFSNEFFDHLAALANAAGDDAEKCVCHLA